MLNLPVIWSKFNLLNCGLRNCPVLDLVDTHANCQLWHAWFCDLRTIKNSIKHGNNWVTQFDFYVRVDLLFFEIFQFVKMEQIKPLKLLSQTHQENPGKKLKLATYKHISIYFQRQEKKSPWMGRKASYRIKTSFIISKHRP